MRLAAVCVVLVLVTVWSSELQAQSPTDSGVEWIVFASGRTGNGDIYALDPSTGQLSVVAGTTFPESGARFDRANNRVVHQRYEKGRTWLVSGTTQLFRDPSADSAPHWSPDGWRLLYSDDRDGTEDIHVARTDGTGSKSLTEDAEPDRYPAWSPDGSKVVFARRTDAGWDLYTLDLAMPGKEPSRLTDTGVPVGHPAWSPDGRWIAFDMTFGDQTEIATVELVTKEIKRLTDRPGNDLLPSWSGDGRRIVFGGQPDSTLNWDVWMIDVETLKLERLTTDPAFDGGPVFVPPAAILRTPSTPDDR